EDDRRRQRVVGNHDVIVAAAGYARRVQQPVLRDRIAAQLGIEKRQRPREDVARRGNVEVVRYAVQRDELARAGKLGNPEVGHRDGRRRVGRAADREEWNGDALEAALIAAERREEGLPEIGNVRGG